jgi:AcrR family transcriptional regulator
MTIPARILRATIRDIPGAQRNLSPREQARFGVAIAAGRRVLAQHGRIRVTLQSLASALMLSPATLRRWFCDIDHLLAEILLRHLRAISDSLEAIPAGVPDRASACRAAYLAATRTRDGALTDAHLLLVRDRHHLPPDEVGAVADLRARIGHLIAGANGAIILGLLDLPELSGSQIGAMLTVHTTGAPAAAAEAILTPAAPRAPAAAQTSLQPPAPAAAFVLRQSPAALALNSPQPPLNAPYRVGSGGARAGRKFAAKEWSPPSLYDRAVAELAKARA